VTGYVWTASDVRLYVGPYPDHEAECCGPRYSVVLTTGGTSTILARCPDHDAALRLQMTLATLTGTALPANPDAIGRPDQPLRITVAGPLADTIARTTGDAA
jgi:hypothetical protein